MSPVIAQEHLTYRQLADRVKTEMRAAYASISDPEGDPLPRSYYYAHGALLYEPVPRNAVATVKRKEALLTHVIPTLIRQIRPRLFALAVPVVVRGSGSEQAWVQVLDAERSEVWRAEVVRREGRRPRVGEWFDGAPDTWEGRLMDAIRAAMR